MIVHLFISVIVLSFATIVSSAAQWSTIELVDEWGEISSKAAYSAAISSSNQMDFPYEDVTARLYVDCESNVWIRFNIEPNLTGGDILDGYNNYILLARVDGEIIRYRAWQFWGSTDINFSNDRTVKQALINGKEIQILFPWYGASCKTIFRD